MVQMYEMNLFLFREWKTFKKGHTLDDKRMRNLGNIENVDFFVII